MSLSVKKQFPVDAQAGDLFEMLTTEFTSVSSWASGIDTSGPNSKYAPVADGVPGGRVCEVPGFGRLDEELVSYEPALKRFAYTAVAEKLPSFVKNLKNTWTISERGSGSIVEMHVTADVSGPIGAVMKPMMRRKFDKTLEAVGQDLKVYVETGRISPRKAKELAKAAR